MARRIPPGRLEQVSAAAFDDRAAELESTVPGTPPQTRWADAPERYRAPFRAKVSRDDDGDQAGINARTRAAIERAIVAEAAPGQAVRG